MSESIYLFFDGNCEAAFRHYEQHLGATIETTIRYGDTPGAADVPEDWHNKIIHGRMRIGEMTVMASDAVPGRHSRPQGFRITLRTENDAEAERIFTALSDGGDVAEPMGETFFATRYGTLADRFAIPWMVLCERRPA